jgi:hypothetical protein
LLLRRRRRKPVLREMAEAEAYARLHGGRTDDVKVVSLPPRRPRFPLRVSGESLRRAFEQRLDKRAPDDETTKADPGT